MTRVFSCALAAALAGCAAMPMGSDQELPGGKTDDGSPHGPELEAVTRFQDDGRFVLRHRLDVAGAEGHRVELSQQPFSHRSQKWHVFPFSTYGQAEHTVDVTVDDPALADRTGVWLYGPRQPDGSWPAPVEVTTTDGTARVTTHSTEYANYAVVVGPRHVRGFSPRYPGHMVRVTWDEEEASEPAEDELVNQDEAYVVMESAERVFLELEDAGERWQIVEPVTAGGGGGDGAGSTDVIWAENDAGELRMFVADGWARSQWWVTEDAHDDDLRLGFLNEPYEGDFEIMSPRRPYVAERHLIVESLGVDGRQSDDPVIVQVVPDGIGEGDATREITLVEDEKCDPDDGGSCLVPMFLLDDGYAEIEDLDELMVSFKATFIDSDEPSTYGIALSCTGECAPEARPTRYPVYYAHGFNTTRESWHNVLEMLLEDPAWQGWARASTVPGYEPVPERTEVLRRNLRDFLRDLERGGVAPPGDEAFLRINIIAHSMGGLDSRYLLGHEKYNNPSCHVTPACEAGDGTMEPCCNADAEGNAITWQERVVSVTTLSTPHCGSSFASWSLEKLAVSVVDWAFRKVAKWMFGMDTRDQQDALRGTLYALSKEFCAEVMEPHFQEPVENRTYDWACATGQVTCDAGALPVDPFHRPVARGGGHELPVPANHPTFFSWGSQSCITGTCGDALTPQLALPYRIVQGREGANDGVVATSSSDFGIFMGIRNNDHFRWTHMHVEEGGLGGFVRGLFGTKSESTEDWHRYWLAELARSGY